MASFSDHRGVAVLGFKPVRAGADHEDRFGGLRRCHRAFACLVVLAFSRDASLLTMAIKVTVTVPVGNVLAPLAPWPETKRACIEAGAQYVYAFLVEYHGKMDWRGPRWIAGPNSGEFARKVVEGWQPPEMTSDSQAVVRNTFGLLAWKITGGTITPKTGRMLAIPLVGRAKGIWPRNSPIKLFRAGNALMAKIGARLEAMYALAASVHQAPWPGAMPPEEAVILEFLKGVELVLKR